MNHNSNEEFLSEVPRMSEKQVRFHLQNISHTRLEIYALRTRLKELETNRVINKLAKLNWDSDSEEDISSRRPVQRTVQRPTQRPIQRAVTPPVRGQWSDHLPNQHYQQVQQVQQPRNYPLGTYDGWNQAVKSGQWPEPTSQDNWPYPEMMGYASAPEQVQPVNNLNKRDDGFQHNMMQRLHSDLVQSRGFMPPPVNSSSRDITNNPAQEMIHPSFAQPPPRPTNQNRPVFDDQERYAQVMGIERPKPSKLANRLHNLGRLADRIESK